MFSAGDSVNSGSPGSPGGPSSTSGYYHLYESQAPAGTPEQCVSSEPGQTPASADAPSQYFPVQQQAALPAASINYGGYSATIETNGSFSVPVTEANESGVIEVGTERFLIRKNADLVLVSPQSQYGQPINHCRADQSVVPENGSVIVDLANGGRMKITRTAGQAEGTGAKLAFEYMPPAPIQVDLFSPSTVSPLSRTGVMPAPLPSPEGPVAVRILNPAVASITDGTGVARPFSADTTLYHEMIPFQQLVFEYYGETYRAMNVNGRIFVAQDNASSALAGAWVREGESVAVGPFKMTRVTKDVLGVPKVYLGYELIPPTTGETIGFITSQPASVQEVPIRSQYRQGAAHTGINFTYEGVKYEIYREGNTIYVETSANGANPLYRLCISDGATADLAPFRFTRSGNGVSISYTGQRYAPPPAAATPAATPAAVSPEVGAALDTQVRAINDSPPQMRVTSVGVGGFEVAVEPGVAYEFAITSDGLSLSDGLESPSRHISGEELSRLRDGSVVRVGSFEITGMGNNRVQVKLNAGTQNYAGLPDVATLVESWRSGVEFIRQAIAGKVGTTSHAEAAVESQGEVASRAASTDRPGVLSSEFGHSAANGVLGVMIGHVLGNLFGVETNSARTATDIGAFYGLGLWEAQATGVGIAPYTAHFVRGFPLFGAMMLSTYGPVAQIASDAGINPAGEAGSLATSTGGIVITSAAWSAQIYEGGPAIGTLLGGMRFWPALGVAFLVGETVSAAFSGAYNTAKGVQEQGVDYFAPRGYEISLAGGDTLAAISDGANELKDATVDYVEARVAAVNESLRGGGTVIIDGVEYLWQGAEGLYETASNAADWAVGRPARYAGGVAADAYDTVTDWIGYEFGW